MNKTENKVTRAALLGCSLVVNLGLLSYFKYGGFLVDNFNWLMHQTGMIYKPAAIDIILPVGISFYTFQTLSYTFDVYRKKSKDWSSFIDYGLYVTFFPQLVAGPIVRSEIFLTQTIKQQRPDGQTLGWGFLLFIIGLFQKVVIADGLMAPVVENVYSVTAKPDFLSAWTGTVAFSTQIFCDFAGYSACAIGIALCLGFTFPENFRQPYASVGFSDFWRRWHISLSSWLRDYLYVTLGGNRKGTFNTYKNLFLTMLIGGLWHGASWVFVVWGGMHGLYLVVERFLTAIFPNVKWVTKYPGKLVMGSLTYFLITLTWVFFRAKTFDQAINIAGAMFGYKNSDGASFVEPAMVGIVFFVTTLLLIFHWVFRERSLPAIAAKTAWWIRGLVVAILLLSIVLISGEDRAFIYFQF
jgi:D-alanyl-lipoteichoic acid acyltransferase DltB (MBOAT superfamily)